MKIYELYDGTIEQTISFHRTIEGAMTAMAAAVNKLNPAMANDYRDDDTVEFTLEYTIRSVEVKE